MAHLKAVGVGICAALLALVLWIGIPITLSLFWFPVHSSSYSDAGGGFGSSSQEFIAPNESSTLFVAIFGFAAGVLWQRRRSIKRGELPPDRDALDLWVNGWRYPGFWATFFGIFVVGLSHNTAGFAISVIGLVVACAWWVIDQRLRR